MTSYGLLRIIVEALDGAGIPFMLTGSLASAYHGAGRSTMDVDLVIDPTPTALNAFLATLPPERFYVSMDTAEVALRNRGQFNVIEIASGWKFDLIIRKATPFAEHEFGRRVRGEFEGIQLAVTSVEDVILSKLVWARLGESARQLSDVAELFRVRASDLDMEYLEEWIDALGVRSGWQAVLATQA